MATFTSKSNTSGANHVLEVNVLKPLYPITTVSAEKLYFPILGSQVRNVNFQHVCKFHTHEKANLFHDKTQRSFESKSCYFQEVLHTIASPHGRVSRIVIHNKTEEKIESLIEFDSIMSAEACKDAINGADIYAGCCTLDVKFSKVSVKVLR